MWDERLGYVLVLVLPGLLALGTSIGWEWRTLGLSRTGRVVSGRVEGVVHRGGRRQASPARVVYSFTDHHGVRREGSSAWLFPEDRQRFATWGPVRVVYDPAYPQHHEPDRFGVRQEGQRNDAG